VKPMKPRRSWQWEWANKQARCPWCDYHRLDGVKLCKYHCGRRRICERQRCPTREASK